MTLTGYAHDAARTLGTQVHDYRHRLNTRCGQNRAICLTAHKLLLMLSVTLCGGQPYQDVPYAHDGLSEGHDVPRQLWRLEDYN